MGLDLTLLPIKFEGSFWFSRTVLQLERREELFKEIMELDDIEISVRFSTYLSTDDKYEESHYGDTEKTPYGERVTFVMVQNLLKFKSHEDVLNDYQNKAVWAYLEQLPLHTKVALYWH